MYCDVSADGVRAAATRLDGFAVKTPLLENEWLNERAGGRVLMKAETLQHGGSFKFRGAMNRLSQLTPAERARGVVAWSSGNHAQGVARAARLFGAPATIVMPEDAPALKIAQVRAYGAEIVFFDRYTEDREEIGRRLAADGDRALVPSYDHVQVIEGQGTLALEAVEQAGALDAAIDAFIICCGGGGMTAGCAVALADISPQTEVWIAEPEGFDETWASIKAGARQKADISRKTICDALATSAPGEITFPILQRFVRGGVTVADAEVEAAMAFAFKYLKLVVEPGGAAALTAILTGKFKAEGRTIAITLSGGNVDPGLYSQILDRHG